MSVGEASLEGDALRVFLGVLVGLVAGKVVGIVGLSWIARRIGITSLPSGVGWKEVAVVGLCGGVGFTMALFIAQLAFPPDLLGTAKLAILCASATAAALAYIAGRVVLRGRAEGSATSESEAEASTTL